MVEEDERVSQIRERSPKCVRRSDVLVGLARVQDPEFGCQNLLTLRNGPTRF
jgi:hypothetical protein